MTTRTTRMVTPNILVLVAMAITLVAGAAKASVVDPALLSYWDMDAITSNQVLDSVGGHHVTVAGSNPSNVKEVTDGSRKVISFLGSDGYLEANDPAFDLTSNFSVSFWAKGGDNSRNVIGYGPDTSGTLGGWFVYVPNGGEFRFFGYRGAGSTSVFATSPSGKQDNQWHHVVGVVNNGTGKMEIWMDGTKYTGSSIGGPINAPDNPVTFTIGTDAHGTYSDYDGRMDDVAVFKRALSAADVRNLYNGGAPGGIKAYLGTSSFKDDFSTDTSANYTASNSTGGGGSFAINSGGNGLLEVSTGNSNTYSVMHNAPLLAAGEKYSIDVPVRSGPEGVFAMISTSTGQPDGTTSFGYRFRRDGSGLRIQQVGGSSGSGIGIRVTDFSGPLTLWVDRVTDTDFRFYAQKPGGNRILIDTRSNSDLAGVANLHVGVQAWDTSADSFAFDNLSLETTAAIEQTVFFQQGVAGYSGTVDTFLDGLNPTTGQSSAVKLIVNPTENRQALIRFDDIVGVPGGIPAGSPIRSATLWLQTGTTLYDGTSPTAVINVHRLLTPFTTGDTFSNSFGGNGVNLDDVEAVSTADFTLGPNEEVFDGERVALDVTQSVQAWVNGQANHGWVITQSVANRWFFSSAEGNFAPLLTVTYVPEPTTLSLCMMGILAFGAVAWRRRRG